MGVPIRMGAGTRGMPLTPGMGMQQMGLGMGMQPMGGMQGMAHGMVCIC